MLGKTLAWLLMTLLALLVSCYAAALLGIPEFRPTLVRSLMSERPLAAISHFGGSALALAIGAFQINGWLRARFPGMHRWAGRFYVAGVAVGGVSGLFMALQSSGGMSTRAGFAALAVCWLVTTFLAYRHIRAGEVVAHRRWMIRSFALTFAAVTLRLYLPVSQIAGIPFPVAYAAIAWLCWVPNLLFAEGLIRATLPARSERRRPAPKRSTA
ncbi:DUF2306 domain-containing protein [Pseudoxanthomonas beigongshangi]